MYSRRDWIEAFVGLACILFFFFALSLILELTR